MKKFLDKIPFKVPFFLIGFVSLVWFLVRVIPKPSRAAYPCMRAAAPLASSFVLYLLSLTSSLFFFGKAKKFLYESRYILFSFSIIAGILIGLFSVVQPTNKVYGVTKTTLDGPNEPIGKGKGVFPGRVVWMHDADATNRRCTNLENDYWSMDKNTNQEVIDSMVSGGLKKLSGKQTDDEAWNALFRYHNQQRGKGDVGYTAGEKIMIKINLNNDGCSYGSNYYDVPSYTKKNVRTSPQLCYAILNQLVNVLGVAEDDITIGDPNSNTDDEIWDKCAGDFPNVHYIGKANGRTPIEPTDDYAIYHSSGEWQAYIPKCYVAAEYLINIPVFKKHHRAGISLTAKNHFGTISPFHGGAWDWHYSLPAPDANGNVTNTEYGTYRCFVDIMGHKDIGLKTVLFLVDGIWGSTNWGHPPIQWRMEPFNGDWPSSLFFSQDEVAIQAVCFDFLYNEFDENHPIEGEFDSGDNTGPYPHFAAVDDFLRQAADSTNWPEGLTYDPENDGTPIPGSLGTFEHWNNATDKQYTRNLGGNTGIELISDHVVTTDVETKFVNRAEDYQLSQNYPNPFNPSTTIEYNLKNSSNVSLKIYNTNGELVKELVSGFESAGAHSVVWDGKLRSGATAASGVYIYELQAGSQRFAKKMILNK